MPSLGDSAFIFVLALLLFGPKKLPELARQLGKLMGEFRRASNEFRMQMEDELRISEQAERQKEIAAIEAAAPVTPAIDPSGTNTIASTPALEATTSTSDAFVPALPGQTPEQIEDPLDLHPHMPPPFRPEPAIILSAEAPAPAIEPATPTATVAAAPTVEPLPIATSGSLHMRPPKTGMPFAQSIGMTPSQTAPRTPSPDTSTTLSPLFNAIPQDPTPDMPATAPDPLASTEASHHG
jgi:sec-independent protein translocase protein TatB